MAMPEGVDGSALEIRRGGAISKSSRVYCE